MRFLIKILAAFCLLLAAGTAGGHSMPQSLVMLDFEHESVVADLTLPLQELELAFKQPLLPDPKSVLRNYETQLRGYLIEHINSTTSEGKPWQVEVESLALQTNVTPFDLLAKVRMTPPDGGSNRKLRFNYSVINHEVMSHCAIVMVRNDWNTAVFSGHPENLGMLQFTVTYLDIDRMSGNWSKGFGVVFMQGMRHISQGTDHLLFILVLLLPAPLVTRENRWVGGSGFKATLRKVVKIVTAFTIGHSLTLAIAGLGWLKIPGRPVEILIALSILVSAIHTIRPLFSGKEVYIAGGFGLVHGLAFATSLSEFGFTPGYMILSILAFNIGIEGMQLIVVTVAMPALVMASRKPLYKPIRWTTGIVCALAALTWIIARSLSLHPPIVRMLEDLAGFAPWLIVIFILILAPMVSVFKNHQTVRESASNPDP